MSSPYSRQADSLTYSLLTHKTLIYFHWNSESVLTCFDGSDVADSRIHGAVRGVFDGGHVQRRFIDQVHLNGRSVGRLAARIVRLFGRLRRQNGDRAWRFWAEGALHFSRNGGDPVERFVQLLHDVRLGLLLLAVVDALVVHERDVVGAVDDFWWRYVRFVARVLIRVDGHRVIHGHFQFLFHGHFFRWRLYRTDFCIRKLTLNWSLIKFQQSPPGVHSTYHEVSDHTLDLGNRNLENF